MSVNVCFKTVYKRRLQLGTYVFLVYLGENNLTLKLSGKAYLSTENNVALRIKEWLLSPNLRNNYSAISNYLSSVITAETLRNSLPEYLKTRRT